MELLIKAVDALHADPIKDERGCYKRGDVVAVYADGKCGPMDNPAFWCIRIPGVPPDQTLAEPQYDSRLGAEPVIVKRRRFSLEVTRLALLQRLKLQNATTASDREITLTAVEWAAALTTLANL